MIIISIQVIQFFLKMPETGKFQIQTPETGNISYLKSGKKREKKIKKREKYADRESIMQRKQ
jgi:hypothetical protein